MFKKIGAIVVALSLFTSSVFADILNVETHKGLQRSPQADRIEDGANDQFTNVYLRYGNIQSVKGRDRLNSTAHADTVVNAVCYYENQAGTTKKLVIAESDELVSYDTDGTNRTSIAGPALTNERWDCQQVADTLYLTSSTNGLYKWSGSGSASLITGVTAPSPVDFSNSTDVGGLTSGEDAVVTHTTSFVSSRYTNQSGVCSLGYFQVADNAETNTVCTSLSSSFNKTCATLSTYSYKITKFSKITGIESEPSTVDTATLAGGNVISVTGKNCFATYSDAACTTSAAGECLDTTITIAGGQTATSGTLAATPSAPFDSYMIYRTVASGSDFFRLGVGEGSAIYTDGKPDVSLGSPFDSTVDTIDPPSFRYIEEYKGALFVAEGNIIKFSHLPTSIITDGDKYWLDTDELEVTGNITGMIKAADSLLIFTARSIYQVTGFGVDTFRLAPLIQGVGAVSDETIEVDINGDIIFFSGTDGLYRLTIGQQQTDSLTGTIIDRKGAALNKLSAPAMDNVFRGTDSQIVLSPSDYLLSHAYYDSDENIYHLFIDKHELMYDATNSAWSYIPATKMLGSVYRKSKNAAGVGVLVDNMGFTFNNWTGYEQGIHSGTITGNSTSSTSNTLTCSGCTFNTTNDGLKGLWIFLDNENDEYHQISSNTGTQITITDTWTTNPISADTFYVAYIIPSWRTKQYNFIKPPDESTVTIIFLNHNKSDSTQLLEVYAFKDKSTIANYIDDIDLNEKFIHSLNTKMRSNWFQWQFRTFIYNTSNTINPPVDVVSYHIDAEGSKGLNKNG